MSKTWTPSKGGTKKELPPEGRHRFRLLSIVDLGSHKDAKFGNVKREIKFALELVDTRFVFNEEKGPQPFVVYKKFTNSLSEKANLRKFFEQWRGKKYSDEDIKKFDLTKWIKFGGELVIEHKDKSDGGQYAQVNNVMPLSEKDKADLPELQNPHFFFRIDDEETHENWDKLFDWDKEAIELSAERKLVQHLFETKEKEEKKSKPAKKIAEDNDEDIPF